ncbi:DUF11 domain-containing protein [Candidatus Uabimicrobium amorphum]|uniref:Large cysteine-rich periplasmic protein OmcB n=1 Tax=Uabimicrobium amorphum TaxID=2596890 RepID=A0A5S9ITY0_UABAM|nr:DUF11 domain-containing protein [Candidatus Uabimicrobium amorphum]BBM87717.1 large cysteine-rich periplasmic protein OmcB [Candidatus Uabimicrobium amorphum]
MKRIVSALLMVFSVALFAQQPTRITIDPVAAVNPVKTQHTFVVTVYDENGNPLGGQKVEWILSRGNICVGDIVEHDDKGAIVDGQKVDKISNHYSVTYTNDGPKTLDFGNDNPNDDLNLTVGQTWCTITSPIEGETHVIAFCPGIKDASQHKVYAVKYWIDADIQWPVNAINRVGDPHTFTFKLIKASSRTPLPGYRVRWKLVEGGVPAYLNDSEENKEVEVQTNEEGEAKVTLTQINPDPGQNDIEIELRDPDGKLLAVRKVTKRWISPQMSIVKTGPAEGILNENVSYTITVTNSGEGEARDVKVLDTLPSGLAFESAQPEPAAVRGNKVRWNLGTLASNESKQINLVVKAKKTGKQVNKAQVRTDRGEGPAATAETLIGAPELYIVKTGQALARLGESPAYRITIKNRGSAPARNVIVKDQIPAGFKYRGRDTGKFALKWNVGTLQRNEERSFDYVLQTQQEGDFVNVAQAVSGGKVVHEARFTTKVVNPNITVKKRASGRVIFLNKTVVFTITVKNEGSGDARGVDVVDTLPSQLEYISSEPQGSFRPARGEQLATVRWQFPKLGAGESIDIKVTARGIAQVPRCINTVKVTSEGREVEDQAALRIQGVSAMHLSTYDTDDPVEVGQQTVYVITARNEGTSACTSVELKNTIPEEMEFVKAEGPGEFEFDETTRAVNFAAVAILQPGDKLTFKVVCRAIAEGSAKNTARLKYAEFDKPIIDEEGTSVYK